MSALQYVVGEVEGHVAEAGWDQPPQLFALVDTEELLRSEPQLSATMGIVAPQPGSLTPIAQEPLADGPLDEALAHIVFGESVLGVVLAQEVVVLPPDAEGDLAGQDDPSSYAARHPRAVEVRMVVGVVRDGTTASVLRLRAKPIRQPTGEPTREPTGDPTGEPDGVDDLLTGPDLAPALARALLATLD